MKLIIQIERWKPEDKKAIVNSVKGFVKALAKRFGFRMEFRKLNP